MSESMMITIYVALIVASVSVAVLIAFQIAIFIYLQNAEFNLNSKIEKVKRFFSESIIVFLNPASKVKVNKTKKA